MVRHKSLLSVFSLALFLAVACNKPNDDAITNAIKAKMFSDPLLKSASVNVVSKDGIVTISGVVPDDAARLAAETIASKTTGVKHRFHNLGSPSSCWRGSDNTSSSTRTPAHSRIAKNFCA